MKAILTSSLMVFAFLSLRTAAQGPIPSEQGKHVISVDVDSVDVLFTVTDKKGKSIRNLKREHFRIYEDKRLQTITNFSAEGNLALTLAVLVDTSGSVREELPFEQRAAIEFFRSTLEAGKDRALVMTFDTSINLLQDYTDDVESLARGVRKMRAGGGTALFDAIRFVSTRKFAGQEGRRILVLITDGDDTSSRATLPQALDAAQRNDVIIYAISTNSSTRGGDKNRRGDDALHKLAQETGGRVLLPKNLEQLSSSFRTIAAELRFQYALAYSPTNLSRDGTYRRILVEPVDPRYVVRARAGYFAPIGNTNNN